MSHSPAQLTVRCHSKHGHWLYVRDHSHRFKVAIGRGGCGTKQSEGDGITPKGKWELRHIMFRPDRVKNITSQALSVPIDPDMGWCDDPQASKYNQLIRKPYPFSHEDLWRDDHLYDLFIIVGYNDQPIINNAGSAIFIHVAQSDYRPTEGCIALALDDLKTIVALLKPNDSIKIIQSAL